VFADLKPPVEQMQKMSLGDTVKAAHPSAQEAVIPSSCQGEGNFRSEISLSTNYFALVIRSPSVFHYDVASSTAPLRFYFIPI